MKESVLRNITKDALVNWDYEHETMEEKIKAAEERLATMENPEVGEPIYNDVVYGSVESAINGLKEILGLDDETIKQLKIDIITKNTVSPEVANKIKGTISNKKLLDVLSLIHDGWVKENGNKFEGRPKNYQFAPLDLLPFKEAVADLLFIKPILEAAGISINMEELEKEFLKRQKEFLYRNQITSTEDLKAKLQSGAEFYPALEGVTTNKGDKEGPKVEITELLKDDRIATQMAEQIGEKAHLVYIEGIYKHALGMVKGHFLEMEQLRAETHRAYSDQENRRIYASSGRIAYYYDEARNPKTKKSYTFYVLIAEPFEGRTLNPEEMDNSFHQEWSTKAKVIWQLIGDFRCGFQFQKIVGRHPKVVYTTKEDGTVEVVTYDAKGKSEKTISMEEFHELMSVQLDEMFKGQTLDDKTKTDNDD